MAAIIIKIDSVKCPKCGETWDLNSNDFDDDDPGNSGILKNDIALLQHWTCPGCESFYSIVLEFV